MCLAPDLTGKLSMEYPKDQIYEKDPKDREGRYSVRANTKESGKTKAKASIRHTLSAPEPRASVNSNSDSSADSSSSCEIATRRSGQERDFYRQYSYAHRKGVHTHEDILVVNLPAQVPAILKSVQFATSLRCIRNGAAAGDDDSATRSSSSGSEAEGRYTRHYRRISVDVSGSYSDAMKKIFREKNRYGIILSPFHPSFVRPLREASYPGLIIAISRSASPSDVFMEGYDGLITKLSSRSLRALSAVLEEVSLV